MVCVFFVRVYICVCSLSPCNGIKQRLSKNIRIQQQRMKQSKKFIYEKTHPSFKNARMHKYTLPAWHSNKNKTSNEITYHTHRERQSRISANVSTECTLLFTFWTGIFCEKFRVTAMVVLKSNHSVRVCICYRCFLLL